jgi:hypothetical protein
MTFKSLPGAPGQRRRVRLGPRRRGHRRGPRVPRPALRRLLRERTLPARAGARVGHWEDHFARRSGSGAPPPSRRRPYPCPYCTLRLSVVLAQVQALLASTPPSPRALPGPVPGPAAGTGAPVPSLPAPGLHSCEPPRTPKDEVISAPWGRTSSTRSMLRSLTGRTAGPGTCGATPTGGGTRSASAERSTGRRPCNGKSCGTRRLWCSRRRQRARQAQPSLRRPKTTSSWRCCATAVQRGARSTRRLGFSARG